MYASTLMSYFAHTESFLLKNNENAIKIMEQYVKINGKSFEAWKNYI